MGVFARPFIEKYFRVADPASEDCYLQVRNKVRRVLGKHLREAKRVVEFYE